MTGWLLGTMAATSALTFLVLLLREPVRRKFGSRVTYGLWLIPTARLFMPTLTHTVERIIPPPMAIQSASATPVPASAAASAQWPILLLALWLAGAAALFLSRMIAYRRERRMILASSAQLARIGAVRIIRSPEICSPVALGILDPVIAIPSNFGRLYGARERRLVLKHELAHHRSGDLVANLFAFALLCLNWFNPLAWVAHAAFRFDQEAACDERVLDKDPAENRADYGRAIAKAASGRALLFASALDHSNNLHRRLQSMLTSQNSTHRMAGRAIIAAGIAFALPLTASRATEYVDVAAPGSARTEAVLPSIAQPQSVGELTQAPMNATHPREPANKARSNSSTLTTAATGAPSDEGDLTLTGDLITINGKTKRWEELTPNEKSQIRQEIAKARDALAKTRLDEARISRAIAALPDQVQLLELQGKLTRIQTGVVGPMIDRAHQEALEQQQARAQTEVVGTPNQPTPRSRTSGQNQLDASLGATLESIQKIDLSRITQALRMIDRTMMAASLPRAQQAMQAAKAELDRIDARSHADQRQ